MRVVQADLDHLVLANQSDQDIAAAFLIRLHDGVAAVDALGTLAAGTQIDLMRSPKELPAADVAVLVGVAAALVVGEPGARADTGVPTEVTVEEPITVAIGAAQPRIVPLHAQRDVDPGPAPVGVAIGKACQRSPTP